MDHSLKKSAKKKVIIICGPTAVGKTAIAIHLARHFQTEIISADSRQCFRELNIGVARPSKQELESLTHHFIASHSIQENFTAADFEAYAIGKTTELFKRLDTIVMAGGTGLYIKAFCEGLDEIPEVDPAIREQIINSYEEKGLHWLQDEVRLKDPVYFATGEFRNPQRMMRALEVVIATGQSILSFRKREKAARDFNIIKIGLELPREELNNRINNRVDRMIEAGLLAEARQWLPYANLNALQTVGYTELFDYLHGKISFEEAVEQIKAHTRQYAKRQMTWFRRDEQINWFHPSDFSQILNACLVD